jgi:hypothetical protein
MPDRPAGVTVAELRHEDGWLLIAWDPWGEQRLELADPTIWTKLYADLDLAVRHGSLHAAYEAQADERCPLVAALRAHYGDQARVERQGEHAARVQFPPYGPTGWRGPNCTLTPGEAGRYRIKLRLVQQAQDLASALTLMDSALRLCAE